MHTENTLPLTAVPDSDPHAELRQRNEYRQNAVNFAAVAVAEALGRSGREPGTKRLAAALGAATTADVFAHRDSVRRLSHLGQINASLANSTVLPYLPCEVENQTDGHASDYRAKLKVARSYIENANALLAAAAAPREFEAWRLRVDILPPIAGPREASEGVLERAAVAWFQGTGADTYRHELLERCREQST